jgi:dTDP-4-amino-4,6-dideoxygalactose transaminase
MVVTAARVVFTPEDRAEITAAIEEILASGALTLGSHTRRFEEAFATAHDSPYAIATASGTSALAIALLAADVRGRDVVLPANTFFATAAAVLQAGGRPVFADIDPDTFALTPQSVEAVWTPHTAAVVVVHIGGLISPDLPALRKLCDDRGATLVEDAAHAHGSTLDGAYAGSFGTSAAFSFYPTKVVTSGEGGMILTASEQVRDEALVYRDQGKGSFTANHHVRLGSAWRMSELHAVTGAVHLRRMAASIEHRRTVAARYTEAFTALDGVDPLPEPEVCRSNFYKYILLLPPGADRTAFKRNVAERHEVRLAGEVYDLPLHHQPVLAEYAAGSLPVAEEMCARHVCLPIHSDMRDDEVEAVIAAVSAEVGALTDHMSAAS